MTPFLSAQLVILHIQASRSIVRLSAAARPIPRLLVIIIHLLAIL